MLRESQSPKASPHPAIYFAALSPLLSGVATVCFVRAAKELHPIVMLAYGSLFGAAILIVFTLLARRWKPIRFARKDLPLLLRVTFLRAIIGGVLFVYGASMTDATKVVFFTKIEPYVVLFLAWLCGEEKINRTELLLLTIHIFGALVLSTGGRLSSLGRAQLGDLLIISSTIISGYSYVDSKKLSMAIGPMLSSGLSVLLGGIFFLPWVYFAGLTPGTWSPAWWYVIAHVILFYVIALSLWYAALPHIRGWVVSALRALGPLAGVPAAYLILGEQLSSTQLWGGAAVLLTSAFIGRVRGR